LDLWISLAIWLASDWSGALAGIGHFSRRLALLYQNLFSNIRDREAPPILCTYKTQPNMAPYAPPSQAELDRRKVRSLSSNGLDSTLNLIL